MRILDIGANVGLFGVAARSAFPQATIHGYEPNTALEPYLAYQARVASLEYFLEAVGRRAGRVHLEVNEAELVHSSSRPDPAGTTPQIALRTAIERIGGSVDLIKMDCEGAEWEMLEDQEIWRTVRCDNGIPSARGARPQGDRRRACPLRFPYSRSAPDEHLRTCPCAAQRLMFREVARDQGCRWGRRRA